MKYIPKCKKCNDTGIISKQSGAVVYEERCSKCKGAYKQTRKEFKDNLIKLYQSM